MVSSEVSGYELDEWLREKEWIPAYARMTTQCYEYKKGKARFLVSKTKSP